MSDTSLRDYRNAEANIKGALKDKIREDKLDNQYLHSKNTGAYYYGLQGVISVIFTMITLLLAVWVSGYFLIILPVIYGIDRYFTNKKKIVAEEMNAKLLAASEERKETDLLSVFSK